MPYGSVRNEAGNWEQVDDQATVVADIFDNFNAGGSLRGIAVALNKAGVPARVGKAWYPTAVGYILDNGIYTGLVQYKGNEGVDTNDVPAIVSKAIYDAAGARLAQLRHGNPTFGNGRQ